MSMLKIIVAPDKFKGSLTSIQVCEAIRRGLTGLPGQIEINLFPMADGGDGFAHVLKGYLGTDTINCLAVDPLGRPVTTSYEWDATTKSAIVELASASGLTLLRNEERDPFRTSTYGTGLQIRHSMDMGCQNIVLGLGGSATNDAGTGILAALGFTFMDGNGDTLQPVGDSLSRISRIIPPGTIPPLHISIAVDVDNPLHGPHGAAYTFASQKGASPAELQILDEGLAHFSNVVFQQTGRDVSTIPGAGAAGGVAAGLIPFFTTELVRGIDVVTRASGIADLMDSAHLVITGEGRLDAQSSRGKVISAVAALAVSRNIPCIAICGRQDLSQMEIQKLGLSAAWQITDGIGEEQSMKDAGNYIELMVRSRADELLELAKH